MRCARSTYGSDCPDFDGELGSLGSPRTGLATPVCAHLYSEAARSCGPLVPHKLSPASLYKCLQASTLQGITSLLCPTRCPRMLARCLCGAPGLRSCARTHSHAQTRTRHASVPHKLPAHVGRVYVGAPVLRHVRLATCACTSKHTHGTHGRVPEHGCCLHMAAGQCVCDRQPKPAQGR